MGPSPPVASQLLSGSSSGGSAGVDAGDRLTVVRSNSSNWLKLPFAKTFNQFPFNTTVIPNLGYARSLCWVGLSATSRHSLLVWSAKSGFPGLSAAPHGAPTCALSLPMPNFFLALLIGSTPKAPCSRRALPQQPSPTLELYELLVLRRGMPPKGLGLKFEFAVAVYPVRGTSRRGRVPRAG